MSLNIDGEFGGICEGEMTNLRSHFEVMTPKFRIEEMEQINTQLQEAETNLA